MSLKKMIGFRNRINTAIVKLKNGEEKSLLLHGLDSILDIYTFNPNYSFFAFFDQIDTIVDLKFSCCINEQYKEKTYTNLTRFFLIKTISVDNIPKIGLYYGYLYLDPLDESNTILKSNLLYEFDPSITGTTGII